MYRSVFLSLSVESAGHSTLFFAHNKFAFVCLGELVLFYSGVPIGLVGRHSQNIFQNPLWCSYWACCKIFWGFWKILTISFLLLELYGSNKLWNSGVSSLLLLYYCPISQWPWIATSWKHLDNTILTYVSGSEYYIVKSHLFSLVSSSAWIHERLTSLFFQHRVRYVLISKKELFLKKKISLTLYRSSK